MGTAQSQGVGEKCCGLSGSDSWKVCLSDVHLLHVQDLSLSVCFVSIYICIALSRLLTSRRLKETGSIGRRFLDPPLRGTLI